VLAALGGCRPATEFDGKTFRHNALGFSVTVPEGWTLTELDGDVVLRLEGPTVEGKLGPVVHVFVRDEFETVDLEHAAAKLQELIAIEEAMPGAPAAPDAKPALVPNPVPKSADEVDLTRQEATIGDLPAVTISRTVEVRGTALRTTYLLASRGQRAWALVTSLPEAADEATQAATDGIVASFKIH
jgi:hypothetical protein